MKKWRRRLVGVILIVTALAGGLYVGVKILLIGSIIQIINAVKNGVVAYDIAVGVGKIVIGIPVTEFLACVLGVAGITMVLHD